MRAAVVSAPGCVGVETVDDPTPGRREVVVAVAACGTDLHILDGDLAPSLPLIPGHEFAGEVVAVGADVSELEVGDRVAADPNLYCGECRMCRRGRFNLCERWAAIGVTTAGAAAEFVTAPAANCVVLPATVDLAASALIEPLSCAVRAYDILQARLGDHVLIYGAGTMGLINLGLAHRVGASAVDVVELNPERLEIARRMGARFAVNDANDLDVEGWDVVIDCTGVVAAIEDGLSRVRRGGTFLQFGVPSEHAVARWSPFRVYKDEITITGSMAVLHSFERAADLFAAGVIDPALLVTDRVPLELYAETVSRFRQGIGLKHHVLPGGALQDGCKTAG